MHTAEGQIFAVEQETGRLLWRRYNPHVYLSFTAPLLEVNRVQNHSWIGTTSNDVVDTDMQYLYQDGDGWHFMDPNTYEQYTAKANAMAGAEKWLKGEDVCQITLFNGLPISVVPPKVEYSLTEFGRTLEPVLKMLQGWGMDYLEQITRIRRARAGHGSRAQTDSLAEEHG